MGIYYFYINKSKQEWFCIDPIELDIKRYALGDNIGSRAFSFLMLNNEFDSTGFHDHFRVGSWIGDDVFITGDDYDEWFRENRDHMSNIGDSILEMISIVSPLDFYCYGGERWFTFFASESDMMTEPVRRLLLKLYREQRNLAQSGKYDDIIDLLRPNPPENKDAG